MNDFLWRNNNYPFCLENASRLTNDFCTTIYQENFTKIIFKNKHSDAEELSYKPLNNETNIT